MLLRRIPLALLLVTVLIGGIFVLPSSGQSSTNQAWTSSITYYTPSETGGTLQVNYYASNGTSYSANPITLAPHKAGTLFIGSVSTVPDGFSGSAVLSADVPIMATYVQFAAGSVGSQYGRVIYTGFSSDNAASTFYIPTVLYDPSDRGSTSTIGVQNVEDFAASVTLDFYAVGASSPTKTKTVSIPARSSYIFRPGDVGLASGFSGSLVIKGSREGAPSTPARVVASSIETDNAGRGAYGFEGFSSGANKVFMASMLCKAGSDQQSSYYAIQNAGDINASVTITYYNTAGNVVGVLPSQNIAPGGKLSTNPCLAGVPNNTSGSAVIESTGAPIIAIGKVKASNGMATAFVGQAQGNTRIALPYVRWAASATADFRTFIAIMNVGTAPANDIRVMYYDGNGTKVAEHRVAGGTAPALNPYIKTNSSPSTAGALSSGQFGFTPAGGAVEIISDQPIVVVARAQRDVNPPLGTVSRFAEDYNGIPIP